MRRAAGASQAEGKSNLTEPYYSSPRRQLFRFANGHGASVVKFDDGTFEIAVIRHTGSDEGIMTHFYINYFTPLGMPKAGLSEDEVAKRLAEIESFPTWTKAEP